MGTWAPSASVNILAIDTNPSAMGATVVGRSGDQNSADVVLNYLPAHATSQNRGSSEALTSFLSEPRSRVTHRTTAVSDQKLSSVPAVVSEVRDHVVFLNCQLPKGIVKIGLPRASFPPALAKFGAHVTFGLSDIDGIRTPVVTSRPRPSSEPDEMRSELIAWANTLP